MVLDGLPDPSGDSLVTMEGVVTGAEATFAEFAKDCVARNCPLGPDPKQTFLDLIRKLRASPIPSADAGLTAGSARRPATAETRPHKAAEAPCSALQGDIG